MPHTPKEFYETVGGRRFLFAVGLTILSAALLYAGKLRSEDFAGIVNWTVVALVIGHSADKFAARGKDEA